MLNEGMFSRLEDAGLLRDACERSHVHEQRRVAVLPGIVDDNPEMVGAVNLFAAKKCVTKGEHGVTARLPAPTP